MLTVGNFAILCACTPQTLRYYDRVNLLKPASVDEWTGYRFYEENQVLDYRKIRSLQGAGFTIGEIRRLLHASEGEVRASLERKSDELEKTLRQLRELQKSSFPEVDMEKEIEEAKQVMRDLCEKLSPEDLEELGLDPAELEPLKDRLRNYWEDYFRGVFIRQPGERLQLADTGWHREGWGTWAEAIEELPELEERGTYYLEISFGAGIRRPVNEVDMSVMMGAVLLRNPGKNSRLVVKVVANTAKENRLRLLKAN